MRFTVRELECTHGENGPVTRVGVFEGYIFGPTVQVGEYTRNMEGCGPFQVFPQGGKLYALYSPNGTTTSVMSLPDCELIASESEDPHGVGYIPMDFHVPRTPQEKSKVMKTPYVDHVNGRWGVVVGCYWGGPYEVIMVDFSTPMTGLTILRQEGDEGYTWVEGEPDTAYLDRSGRVCLLFGGKEERNLTDEEEDVASDAEDRGEKVWAPKETLLWTRPGTEPVSS